MIEVAVKMKRHSLLGGPLPKTGHTERAALFLTKPEVRKDIREIQRTLNADSDSDCSVRSDEIIDCRNDYPVKPRKTPRWGAMNRDAGIHADYGGRDDSGNRADNVYYDLSVVESTMAYIKNLRATKPELWNAEEERDRLDHLRQSIQNSLLTEAKEFNAIKREQEGYIRTLQGAHMRGMLLQNACTRQNAITYDVVVALKRRRESLAMVNSEIARLKVLNVPAKPPGKSGKGKGKGANTDNGASLPKGSSSIIRVSITGTSSSTRDIYLFHGQVVDTPMGEAIVHLVYPAEKKVVLRLPFGTMYAHLHRLLCWGIRSKENNGSGSSGTDIQLGETLDVASDRALALRWRSLRHSLVVPSNISRGIDAIAAPMATAELSGTVAGNATTGDSLVDTADMMDEVDEPDPENDNRLLFSLSQGAASGAEIMQQYFIPVTPDPEQCRSKLRSNLVESIGHGVQDPRLVMSHPSALPHLLETKTLKTNQDTHFCPTSLGSSIPNQPSVTGTLTWDANTDAMRKVMQERGEIIRSLEEQVYDKLQRISASRRSAAKLAVSTSALRMGMFTRRVRHRNNLSDRGINGGPALATLDPSTVKEARAAAGSDDPVAISLALQSIAAKAEVDTAKDTNKGKAPGRFNKPPIKKEGDDEVEAAVEEDEASVIAAEQLSRKRSREGTESADDEYRNIAIIPLNLSQEEDEGASLSQASQTKVTSIDKEKPASKAPKSKRKRA